MFRIITLGLLLLAAVPARAQQEQQALVDRSTLALQELMTSGDRPQDAVSVLQRARAVLICPRVFRAAFIIGGEGGGCVLLARDGAGSWSSPAFYSMGSGGIGLQIGIQDGMVAMMVMTDAALNAVLNSQFTIGADASIAIATIGGGIEGGTTTAAGADIVAVARSRGLFAGISLSGTILTYQPEAAQAYYGQAYGARQVVISMEAHNPGADPLRATLIRFGNRQ